LNSIPIIYINHPRALRTLIRRNNGNKIKGTSKKKTTTATMFHYEDVHNSSLGQ